MLRLLGFAISPPHVAMRNTTEKHHIFRGGPLRRLLAFPRARDTSGGKMCSNRPHLWPHVKLELAKILQNHISKLCTAVFWQPPSPRSRYARTSATLLRSILATFVYSDVLRSTRPCATWTESHTLALLLRNFPTFAACELAGSMILEPKR